METWPLYYILCGDPNKMIVKYLKIVYLHFLKGKDSFISEPEVSTNFSMMENKGQRADSLMKHMGEGSELE